MQAHTRKHRTDDYNVRMPLSKENASKRSSNWRDAAKEVFGDHPSTALNLRGLRNREGLTQEQLGKAIGIEQSNISKMERGERQINAKTARKLEELFNVDYRLFL